MTDHKFEPFQRVIGMNNGEWHADLFSHYNDIGVCVCVGDHYGIDECLPYTPETAHLLGTLQPYEPPKPPQEYEWGQKVEVRRGDFWLQALYVGKANPSGHHVLIATQVRASIHEESEIRPLPDDTAAH